MYDHPYFVVMSPINHMESKFAVIAIGGNAIILEEQEGTIPEQFKNCEEFLNPIAVLVSQGWKIVLVHGNGPQVGSSLLRVEYSQKEVYPLPLHLCVADTQGEMGFMIQNVLRMLLHRAKSDRPIAAIITQTLVDPNDPAFQSPGKPVGPYYTKEQAEKVRQEKNWTVAEDAKGRWRRTVPSPQPKEILETDMIKLMVNDGAFVIACGGGGIPVVKRDEGYQGVDAVIDKDLASSVLASQLEAEMLIITTGEDHVSLHYRKKDQQDLVHLSLAEAERYLASGEFPKGSMGPKITAAINFIKRGGKEVLICTPEHLLEALQGKTGTRISAT